MMNYNVNAKYPNAKISVETNDLHIALKDFWDSVVNAEEVDIINGFTGEVLVHIDSNPKNTWIVDEWEMILLGSLVYKEWGKPEPETKFDLPDLDLMNDIITLLSAEQPKTALRDGKFFSNYFLKTP